jgi:precorrin-6B methylase 2
VKTPKKSLIDDVSLDEEKDKGDPIMFTNQEIRRMLRLAEAGPRDAFCDLGCGWGQNLIIALTEFEVARAVGVEKDACRKRKCEERLRNWEKRFPSLSGRWAVFEEDFDGVLSSESPNINLSNMTVVFYGLTSDHEVAENIERQLVPGARLVYYFNCLFPEMLPDRVDFPFYVSIYPFRKPKSEAEWLNAIVGKEFSTLKIGQQPSVQELWEEFRHDADVRDIPDLVSGYKTRLKKIIQRKE